MKLSASFITASLLVASTSFAGQGLPRCIGSQSTGCDSSIPASTGVYAKCSVYKSSMLCGEEGIQVSFDSCKAENGEMYCLIPTADASPQEQAQSSKPAAPSVESSASSTFDYNADAVTSCVNGSSPAAQQALADAYSQARAECTNSVPSNGSESLSARPTSSTSAQCVANVSVVCSQ